MNKDKKPNQLGIEADFHRDISELESLHHKYQQESGDDTPISEDYFSLFIEWLLHIHEYYEEDLHSGRYKQGEILDKKTCHRAASRDAFLKSYFPSVLDGAWPIRFTRKFIRKLGDVKQQGLQMRILNSMRSAIKGYMPENDPNLINGLSYMSFLTFQANISSECCYLVSCIHVERYPEFDGKNKIKAFKYIHVLRFLDILNEGEKANQTDVCLSFLERCKNDPARQEFQPAIGESRTGIIHKNKTGKYYMFETKPSSKGDIIVKAQISYDWDYGYNCEIIPNNFKIEFLTPEEIEDLIYVKDIHRWAPKKEHAVFQRRQGNAMASKINAEILERFADFESSGKLVNLLEKMQSLKLKLTPEERRLIGQNGNVLAIGRSGTGKTTCCVLRLFSQDMLFKIRLAQAQVKQGILRDARYMADQLDNLIGIHSIFITASPVLTNEVGRYYENLSKKIKEEMKKKEKSNEGTPNTSPTKPAKQEESKIGSTKSPEKESAKEQNEETKQEESFEEEDYLMDEEEVEAQAKFSKHYAFDGIPDKEFPLFLTVKRVVLMIDGTLQKPFFARKKDNSIIGSDTQAQWHNETKGLMMISDKFREQNNQQGDEAADNLIENQSILDDKKDIIQEDKEEDEESENEDEVSYKVDEAEIEAEYERYLAVQEKRKEQRRLELELKKKTNMNFEVDYEYFYNHFWMRYLSPQERPSGVTPALVWSEIMSSIKGSPDSHLYPNYHLASDVYIALPSEDNMLLNGQNRTTIHKYFMYYEEWKSKEGGYDFMDVVNHVLNEIRRRGYNGVPIHFIMIDEIQDLSHATILLLMNITEQSVFFAGDTAQTIAKGVGIRFSDLSSLFRLTPEKEHLWKKPTVHQLTVNFRSHSRILDMANSVVTLIETFFPKTIDKLKKEKSEIDGPKPILLEDVDLEVLFALLFGNENFKSHRHSQNQGGALEKPPIEFGCNQCIIVRDQESKKNLPPLLKHALCLTVYEAKGLEFDDIILYNFFSESIISQKEWELLRFLEIESKEVDKDTFERFYFTYKEEDLSDLSSQSVRKSEDDKKKGKDDLDLQAPNLFNAELDEKKNKYNMKKVTLPKRSSAILNFENYSGLCNEFKQLYVALTRPRNRIIIFDDNITKRQEIERYWKQLSLVQVINKAMLQAEKIDTQAADKDLESFKSLIVSTSKGEWKKQGLKMFRNKYYEQAAKCFEKAEEEKLYRRALAYMTAEKASSNLNKIKSEHATLLNDLKKAKGAEAKEKNTRVKKLKVEEKTCYEDYEKAALIFFELDLLKQASQCFFSAGKYERALEIYEKLGLLKEAGEACVMLKQFDKAAEMFVQGGDLARAIDCYDIAKDYDKILTLLPNMTSLSSEQRKVYGKKYVPFALQRLTQEVQFQSPEKQKNQEGSSSEDEEEKETLQLRKGCPEEEVKIESEIRSQPKKSVDDMSFDIIDKSEGQKNLSNMSFENVEDVVSDFEHLSQYDLKDEFLRSEDSVSIIESIKSHRRENSFVASEYSAIDHNYLMDARYQLVQTKGDIFIQDSIIQKIIKYIGLFSDEMKKNLEILCSKDIIIPQESEHNISNLHELLDLDNLSPEVIHFILDFLEQNRLHKLCIFVCNRYNLAAELGRYLVNITLKYSTLATEDIRATATKLFTARNRQIHQEKAFVSNTAVHHILEIVNPNLLRLKKKEEQVNETNSLGESCFRSLISLGFWKKCLFMMDYSNSLALASTFASFENYKLIFLTGSNVYTTPKNIQTLIEDEGFGFLPFKVPQNKEEVNAAIVGLESAVWNLSEKLPMYLNRRYKPSPESTQVKVPDFPSYFTYNSALWNFIVNKEKEKLSKCIEKGIEDLENLLRNKNPLSAVDELKLFDTISFLIQLALLYSSNQPVSDLINNMLAEKVTKLINALKKLMELTTRVYSPNAQQEIIVKAILSPLRIRFIERSPVLLGFGLHNYIVHISSPIAGELISTENTANPALIFDIEANFILAPITSCFAEIKKKMASIIHDMTDSEEKSDLGIGSDTKKNLTTTKVDILGLIDKKLAEVLGYYAKTSIQNPIDFHHICDVIQSLVTCEIEYLDALREAQTNAASKKAVESKEFQNEKVTRVESIGQEFEKWRLAKEKQGKGEEKSFKKQKLVRATWEEQALITKMQQIAKKRKAIKKQEIKEFNARKR